MKNKKIALIPPAGIEVSQDGFFNRISNYFKTTHYIDTYFITISNEKQKIKNYDFDHHIIVKDYNDLVKYVKKEYFDIILHRTWMHRYKFAGNLSRDIKNVVFYIKDWMEEIPQEEYKFLFETENDYSGIKQVFTNGRIILSHYSKAYTNMLAKKYNVSKKKFIFFPEYCNKNNFTIRETINYNPNNKKQLLMAGGFVPTTAPKYLIENKLFFDTCEQITKSNIIIDCYLLQKNFDNVFNVNNKLIWQDWLYENKFNDNFNIKLGTRTSLTIFHKYDFAIAAGLKYNKRTLCLANYTEAVVSKIALYLEIGIPLIVHKRWVAIAKIVRDNNIGIIISNKDLKNLNNIINVTYDEYKQMVENIYKFRNKYTYNKKTMKPILELLK